MQQCASSDHCLQAQLLMPAERCQTQMCWYLLGQGLCLQYVSARRLHMQSFA